MLWDLKLRSAAARFLCQQPLRSLSWFSDSKSFVVGHLDGAMSIWLIKQPLKPVSLVYPHGTRVPAFPALGAPLKIPSGPVQSSPVQSNPSLIRFDPVRFDSSD